MQIFIILIILIAVLFLLAVVLVVPGSAPKELREVFANRFYAHRGLHLEDKSIPENSMPAFDAACEKGYGIELDVRLSKDGEVVVLHDPNLARPCGFDANVEDLTYNEIKDHNLWGTEYKIPLFKDVLECVAGRVPLIIEIKPCKDRDLLSKKTVQYLSEYSSKYSGDYCVESFDPHVVRWLKRNVPDVIRGQLANQYGVYEKSINSFARFMASHCFFNLFTKPQFIAYKTGPKPWPVKLTRLMGAPHFVWTSEPEHLGGTPAKDKAENDAVIFEFYTPPTKY